jgi:purine nucleosidase
MGGAVRIRGNITPYAEFNIFSDPFAAKIVFESGLLITLVPLDVTHRVTLSPQWMGDKISPLRNSFSKFIIEATGYDPMAQKFQNKQRVYLHDPLAVGVVIDPGLVKKERVAIHVETREGEHYGQTVEVEEGMKPDVCLRVDAERFLELFVSRLANQ